MHISSDSDYTFSEYKQPGRNWQEEKKGFQRLPHWRVINYLRYIYLQFFQINFNNFVKRILDFLMKWFKICAVNFI